MEPNGNSSQPTVKPTVIGAAMNVMLALLALAAVAILALEYGGFKLSPGQLADLQVAKAAAVVLFAINRLVMLAAVGDRRGFVLANWNDFALLILAAVVIVARTDLRGEVLSAGALYILVSGGYTLAKRLALGWGKGFDFAMGGARLASLLIGCFAFLCLAGAVLLMLPSASTSGDGLNFFDTLFIATSACTLTGLAVRNVGADFSLFGQAVILALIQLGGLGILIFGAMLAKILGMDLTGRRSNSAVSLAPSTKPNGSEVQPSPVRARRSRLRKLIFLIVAVTFVLEFVGAVLSYPMFAAPQGIAAPTQARAIWYSVFHSISAFCNSGFSLYDQNLMEGVHAGWPTPMRDRWQTIGVLAPLIVLGGLGLPVLIELAAAVKSAILRLFARRGGSSLSLSLHTKTVLAATLTLILVGAGGLLLVEPASDAGKYGAIGRTPVFSDDTRGKKDWPRMKGERRIREAIFQSVSARTGGFNTIDPAELSDAGKWWMCGLMIIGGSPAGTAGGMKTVTIAVMLAAIWSILRRRGSVEMFGRALHHACVRRALAASGFYLLLVGAITLLLCMALRTGFNFIDLLFEACSACGNVGLTTGATESLDLTGKFIIIAGMFLGRLAPLALMLSFAASGKQEKPDPADVLVIG